METYQFITTSFLLNFSIIGDNFASIHKRLKGNHFNLMWTYWMNKNN